MESSPAHSSGLPKLPMPLNTLTKSHGGFLLLYFVTSVHRAGRKVVMSFFCFPDEKSMLLCWHP